MLAPANNTECRPRLRGEAHASSFVCPSGRAPNDESGRDGAMKATYSTANCRALATG